MAKTKAKLSTEESPQASNGASAKTSAQKKSTSSHVAYDDVPYMSYPFPQTNPVLLQGIAKLFGLSVPSPEKARILEIGCASGANILAIAACFPKSHCVGIDYSQKQIEAGLKDVEALGVTNLELKHMSVMDVTKEFGVFDYIICHGVMSWVTPDVQDKIMEVCKTNLAPDGISYISYNTLPGWNSVRSIRDMMLYHTSHFDDATTKVQQARWLLKFMMDSTKDRRNLLSNAVERELQTLSGQPDWYLLHDHLEENNFAFYFHEFMAKAQQKGLQYLGEVMIDTMFSGNLSVETAKVLSTSNDIVRTEQFMDFINDRRFRHTLLCHNDRILNWNVSDSILRDGWLLSRFSYPDGFETHDITSKTPVVFGGAGNLTLTTDDTVVLAMLKVFFEHRYEPMRIEQILPSVRKKLKDVNFILPNTGPNGLEDTIARSALRYLFMGGLAFYSTKFPYVSEISAKPLVAPAARYQAARQEWVSNQRQESGHLAPVDKMLVTYLDGTRDVPMLVECMLPHFEDKTLVLNEKDKPVEDMAVVKTQLFTIIPQRLKGLCEFALLVG